MCSGSCAAGPDEQDEGPAELDEGVLVAGTGVVPEDEEGLESCRLAGLSSGC